MAEPGPDARPPRSLTAWRTSPARAGDLTLVCLPHAGAGASAFATWAGLLPTWVRPVGVTLPGRETRLGEPAVTSMAEVLDTLAPTVATHLDGPFVLMGHSLGALVAYELAHRLSDQHGLAPELVIVSGRAAPHLPRRLPQIHEESDPDLLRHVATMYGGIPDAVLDSPALLDIFLPALRADLTVLERYTHADHDRLPTDLVVLGAVDDPTTTLAELDAWATLVRGRTSVHTLPDGGHFFPRTRAVDVIRIVAGEIAARLVP